MGREKRAAGVCCRSLRGDWNGPKLEFEPNSNLTFATWEILQGLADSGRPCLLLKDVASLRTKRTDVRRIVRASWLESIYRSCVIAVEEIEHFKENLSLYALAQVKAFGDTHVQIDEGRRSLGVAGVQRISEAIEIETFSVEQTIAVEIRPTIERAYAVVETALRAENAENSVFQGSCQIPCRRNV